MSYEEFKAAIKRNRKNNKNAILVNWLEVIKKEIQANVDKVNEDLDIQSYEFLAEIYSAGGFQEVGLKSAGKRIAFSLNGHDEISVYKINGVEKEKLGSLTYINDNKLINSVTNKLFEPKRDVIYFLSQI
ncbi:hypothetical protein [Atopococcus tabaci]|uniref:hypothetical protein n=1 Tax=Atopococcus tabaci TaxID=269774 RepID=UPI00047F7147|nr:hypothetical protein [Atopococcus tabaci]